MKQMRDEIESNRIGAVQRMKANERARNSWHIGSTIIVWECKTDDYHTANVVEVMTGPHHGWIRVEAVLGDFKWSRCYHRTDFHLRATTDDFQQALREVVAEMAMKDQKK